MFEIEIKPIFHQNMLNFFLKLIFLDDFNILISKINFKN